MSGQSSQLIHQLLKAEEEAEALITKARENRVRKLREAQDAANDEIAVFKKKEEEKFQAELAKASGGASGDNETLEGETVKAIKQVNDDYTSNRTKLVEYMSAKVLSVNPELGQIQIALIQAAAM
jgi:V-type H+-transporting ATPase subunit G